MEATRYQQACEAYQKTEEAYAAASSNFVADFAEGFSSFLQCDKNLVTIKLGELRRERIPQPEWSIVCDFSIELLIEQSGRLVTVSQGELRFITEDCKEFVVGFGKTIYDMEEETKKTALFREVYRNILEKCKYHH